MIRNVLVAFTATSMAFAPVMAEAGTAAAERTPTVYEAYAAKPVARTNGASMAQQKAEKAARKQAKAQAKQDARKLKKAKKTRDGRKSKSQKQSVIRTTTVNGYKVTTKSNFIVRNGKWILASVTVVSAIAIIASNKNNGKTPGDQ